MNSGDILSRYIQVLASTEDSLNIIATAFEEVANKYSIGDLRSSFFVAPTFSTKGGERREDVLYTKGVDVEDTAGYGITYTTGEKGIASFAVHRYKGMPAFTEQEKEEIKPFFDALFVHFGRYRMINAIKNAEMLDGLTGIYNSMGFIRYIEILIKKKELSKYNAFYFNLARFNMFNKRFGAKETDLIIGRYAKVLSTFLKEGECVGRLGGDNFVALIEKARTFQFLSLISGAKTYAMQGDQKVPVVVSAVAGIAELDNTIDSSATIMTDCGMALNVAKHIEKKPYVFVTADIKEQMYKEHQYISSFLDAIKKREFKVYYQPKVNTDTYEIVGAEALARWQYNGELLAPREFIKIFERNGMICKLDFYMLEQVCKDVKEWLEKGIEPGRVSVNLSRKHLSNYYLAEDIMQILSKYAMESKYIEIELTETVDEQETEQLITFMKKMKQNNIAVSIDDFGTGYSSLNLLRSFPVDVLKIDKSFIDRLESADQIVLSNIIKMATELNMSVVAEGVETRTQLEYLKAMNCKVVQGFLFDKAMPKEAYEDKMLFGKYEM